MSPNLSLLKLPFSLPKRKQAIVEGKAITACKQCRHCIRVVSPEPEIKCWCEVIKYDDAYMVLHNINVIHNDRLYQVTSR